MFVKQTGEDAKNAKEYMTLPIIIICHNPGIEPNIAFITWANSLHQGQMQGSGKGCIMKVKRRANYNRSGYHSTAQHGMVFCCCTHRRVVLISRQSLKLCIKPRVCSSTKSASHKTSSDVIHKVTWMKYWNRFYSCLKFTCTNLNVWKERDG